jgi:hypothetical protein
MIKFCLKIKNSFNLFTSVLFENRDSVVGIATSYGLEDEWLEFESL